MGGRLWNDDDEKKFYDMALEAYTNEGIVSSKELMMRTMERMPVGKRKKFDPALASKLMKSVRKAFITKASTKPTVEETPSQPADSQVEPFERPTFGDIVVQALTVYGAQLVGNVLGHPFVRQQARALGLAVLGQEVRAQPGFGGNRMVKGPKVLVVGFSDRMMDFVKSEFGLRTTLATMTNNHLHYDQLKEWSKECDLAVARTMGEARVEQILKANTRKCLWVQPGTSKNVLRKQLNEEIDRVQPPAVTIQ